MDIDIERGYLIEFPPAFIPWGMTKENLFRIFPEESVKFVTEHYYGIPCVSLKGVPHWLGFHFRDDGILKFLELFAKRDVIDVYSSWEVFQSHLERCFGEGVYDYRSEEWRGCSWKIGKVRIYHYMFDRFGVEERLEIFDSSYADSATRYWKQEFEDVD